MSLSRGSVTKGAGARDEAREEKGRILQIACLKISIINGLLRLQKAGSVTYHYLYSLFDYFAGLDVVLRVRLVYQTERLRKVKSGDSR